MRKHSTIVSLVVGVLACFFPEAGFPQKLDISIEPKMLARIPNDVDLSYEIVFSPSGNHVAYGGKIGEKWHVFIDGKRGRAFDRVRFITFSPDGSQLAYAAKKREKWYLIVGEQVKEKELGGGPVFSPDSKHLAFIRYDTKTKKSFVVLD